MKSYMRLILSYLLVISFTGTSQNLDKGVLNWYNDHKQGMATEKAYKYLKKRNSDTVVVAIIDSGIDIEHEDLQGKIWTNKKEIPGNGIDDDKNGYVDDIHGWNFLGNKDGKNQDHARLEATRIYAKLKPRFENIESQEDLDKSDVEDYKLYMKTKAEVEKERKKYSDYLVNLNQMTGKEGDIKEMINSMLKTEEFTEKDLNKFKPENAQQEQLVSLAHLILSGTYESFFQEQMEPLKSRVNYHYNPDYDDRSLIGDDYLNIEDTDYGNNDVKGADATHGTHVGGIVGALRNNKKGGDGVAEKVLLMSLRAVPDGDEFDKDIALAIRYAVDNGAKIINASFGKAYSQIPEEVYSAICYAQENDVLFVHAAGNSGQNLDEFPNYPANMFPFQDQPFTNYLSIGASTRFHEEKLAASFSNYSSTRVDVFAPGFEIYNTVPENEYAKLQGTSMAAPMVSGVAAIIKGYFPDFTMAEIRQIILDSAVDFSETMQIKPAKPSNKDDKVKFGTLCATGGVVNVLQAVKLADERYKNK